MALRRELGLRALILMNIVAVVGIRWVANAARLGPASIVLWVAALLCFFLPQAFAVREFSRRYPDEGGIYRWTEKSFGPLHGFVCGWCYWTNNLVYFPSLLTAAATFAAFAVSADPEVLSESPTYVGLFALTALWIAIGLNVVGLRIGKWVNNLGALSTWIPIGFLIGIGFIAVVRGRIANPIDGAAFLPELGGETYSRWAEMCFAFAGLELAAVLGGEIRRPRWAIPRGIIYGGIGIVAAYILGTAAMIVLLPSDDVRLTAGVVQALTQAFGEVGWTAAGPLLALLLTIGVLGGLGAWLGGRARIPFVAGLDSRLPAAFGRTHPRWGTPHIALLIQGAVASFFLIVSFIGAGVEEAYVLLLDMTIIVYFIPYLYLFTALVRAHPDPGEAIPGGAMGRRLCGLLGALTTAAAIAFAFVPGDVGSVLLFELKLAGGVLLFVGSGLLVYHIGERRRRPTP